MTHVILPARVHRRIIDEWTTSTERLMHPDSGKRLPCGDVEWDMPEEVTVALQPFMLEDETYADALERLLEEAGGRIS